MTNEDIKQQMMELWKETFHDSDDYIKLIFDNCFNPEFIECAIDKNRVVASMIGIPYNFKGNNKELKNHHSSNAIDDKNNNDYLRGLYLCGLATKPEYRGRSIMSKLIEKINNKARSLNFDFTFLIPANQGLRKFYFDRGYVDSFYQICNRYLSSHSFRREYENLKKSCSDSICNNHSSDKLDIKNYKFNILNVRCESQVDKVIQWLLHNEGDSTQTSIVHTEQDWNIVIKENYISKGMIVYLTDCNDEIVGLAFMKEPDKRSTSCDIAIPYLIATDVKIKFMLLQYLNDFLKLISCNISDDIYKSLLFDNCDLGAKFSVQNREVIFEILVTKFHDNINYSCRYINHTINPEFTETNRIGNLDEVSTEINLSNNFVEENKISKNVKFPINNFNQDSHFMNFCNTSIDSSTLGFLLTAHNLLPDSFISVGEDYVLSVMQTDVLRNTGSVREAIRESFNVDYNHADLVSPSVSIISNDTLARSYGMLRMLNPYNILKFADNLTENEKYPVLSIFSKEHGDCEIETISGKYLILDEKVKYNAINNAQNITSGAVVISSQSLSEIIFQRSEDGKVVKESFGIPTIFPSMWLMLD